MSTDAQDQLLDALAKIDRPGTFCTSGVLPATLPGLEVAGIGPVGLPLGNEQMAALKKKARQAPYGKGTETVVDTAVRRVWEIDADQVAVTNPHWSQVVKQAVQTAQSELGLEKQKLNAHLYKLLLYEKGCFFLPHRDGEKLERMVATLVIALPSAHEGGELVVRHEGREVTVDFSARSQFDTQFAAFYADCEHEIRPVTRGFRLALVYNLTLARAKGSITAPQTSDHIERVARLLARWKDVTQRTPSSEDGQPPSKLAVLLDHKYSPAGLAFDVLKGIDRVKADVLFAAARQTGYDASLALVTYWESGSATGDYGYGRYGEDEGEHEMEEVFAQSLTARHFRDADGKPLAFGRIRLRQAEILSETPLNENEPDKEDFEGYTGNAGMTLERWYHRAAVLLWPADARFDVLCEAGVASAVGGLEQMVKHWQQAKKDEQPALKGQCLEFASRIINTWPERPFARGYAADFRDDAEDFVTGDGEEDEDVSFEEWDEDPHDDADDLDEDALVEDAAGDRADDAGDDKSKTSLLALLDALGDPLLIAAWIQKVLARDASIDPGQELGKVCQEHGWLTFQDELLGLFESTSNETLERHARLLADWSLRKDKKADRKRLCSQLAGQLMSAVERWSPGQRNPDWRAATVQRDELIVLLVKTLVALDEPGLFDRLTTYILERPKQLDLTTVQVPALLALAPWLRRNLKQPSVPLQRWLTAITEELESRAAHPPQQPTDWRRASATGCQCADCQALSRFLNDPNTETLRLPLAEARRRHLHQVIGGNRLDLTHVTERRGRPYTLVCTKTQASYERALQAYQVDLDQLAAMRDLAAWYLGVEKRLT